jgi:hypothetical protein
VDWCLRTGDSFLASWSLAISCLIFGSGTEDFFRRFGILFLVACFGEGVLSSSEMGSVEGVLLSSELSAASDSDFLGRFLALFTLYAALSLLSACSFGGRFSASELSVFSDTCFLLRLFGILRPRKIELRIAFVLCFVVGKGVTLPCIWFLLMIRPQVSCGGFLPPGDSSRKVFDWLNFTSRVRVPTEAGIISRLSMIFRQKFLTGLTFRAFLRRLLILLLFGRRLLILLLFGLVLKDSLILVHLFSVCFSVKDLGVNNFLLF